MTGQVIRITLLLGTTMAGLLLLCALYLLSTSSGAGWLVKQTISVTGENLSVEQVSGSLLTELELDNIEYRTPAARSTIKNLAVSVNWKTVLAQTLTVRALSVDGILIVLSDNEERASAEPFDATAITLPVLPIDVAINTATATHMTIKQGDKETFVANASAELHWKEQTLSLDNLAIEIAEHSVAANVVLASPGGGPLTVSVTSEFDGVTNANDVHGSLLLNGPLKEIDTKLNLTSPVKTNLSGTIRLDGANINFVLSGAHDSSAMVVPNLPFVLQSGTIAIEGDLATARLNYAGTVKHPATGDINIEYDSFIQLANAQADGAVATGSFAWEAAGGDAFALAPLSGEGTYKATNERLQISHDSAPPYRLSSELLIFDLSTSPQVAASIAWVEFGPLNIAGRQLKSKHGSVTIDGPLSTVDVVATFAIQIDELPDLDIQANAHVTDKDVQLSGFNISTLGGDVHGSAQAQWAPTTHSKFELRATALDLAELGFYKDTKLDFVADGTLTLINDIPSGDINLHALTGRWLEQTLNGNAALSIHGDNIELRRSEFTLGKNRLNARAQIGETIDGKFEVDIASFAEIDPRLRGRLSGSGHVSGAVATPRVDLSLVGRALKFAQFSSDEFSLSVIGDLASADAPLAAELTLKEIAFDNFSSNELNLNIDGNPQAHTINLALNDPQLVASFEAEGSLRDKHWRGVISTLHFKQALLGKWQLEERAEIKLEKAGLATISALCLNQVPSSVCIEANRAGALDGSSSMDVRSFPLALLAGDLPEDASVRGTLHAHMDAHGIGDSLNANGSFDVSNGQISTEVGSDEQTDFKAETFTGEFTSTVTSSKLDVAIAITDFLSLNTLGTVVHGPEGVVDVNTQLSIPNLAWLENFVPELAGSVGSLTGDIAISGTVAAPDASAEFALNNGAIRYAEAGLAIDELRLSARSSGYQAPGRELRFNGLLGSPAGDITLDGAILASSDEPLSFEVQITGEDFALARLPNVELDISPKLMLRGSTDLLQIGGEILVPSFNYTITQLPKGTVAVSGDQVVIDANGDPIEELDTTQSAMMQRLRADLVIKLGDDVSITGLGVHTNLIGDLRIRRDPALHKSIPGIANGTVNMKGGSFNAYGQKLSITKGTFLFAGPIDNPNINVRAERDNIPLTAGIHAIGSAKDPKISLFSSPSLSDAETLAYIMTGRGLNDASKSEAQLLTEAAFAFGLEQASVITNGVRDLFGLDSFGVGGADTDNVSLTAGKRLTPKLSLRSQLDVFDQLWSFFLRYDLSKNWGIEAESGRRQGSDLLYRIEREYLFSPE